MQRMPPNEATVEDPLVGLDTVRPDLGRLPWPVAAGAIGGLSLLSWLTVLGLVQMIFG